jgi:hypothetical protein
MEVFMSSYYEMYMMNARSYEMLARSLDAQGIDASHYYNAAQDCLEKASLELLMSNTAIEADVEYIVAALAA